MTTLELLRRARKRLSAPSAWTVGVFARDAHGFPIATTDPRACRWCILGALVAEESYGQRNGAARVALPASMGGACSLGMFNDAPDTTHAMVLAVYDRAIARIVAALGPS